MDNKDNGFHRNIKIMLIIENVYICLLVSLHTFV